MSGLARLPAPETLAEPGSPALRGHGLLPRMPTCSEEYPPLTRRPLRLKQPQVFAEMWVRKGDLSPCLSMYQVGSCAQFHPWCLIGGSVPLQLDEEEERRKRRREKNKVAAARCRNKKKERTEFLQRVSGAAAVGGTLSFAGADVLHSQGHHWTLDKPEKVEGPMFPPLGLDPGY